MANRTLRPLVTIGIPNFNYGAYLRECVESALAQTYENIEVLVADNGSTDGSIEYLESVRDRRLRHWRNERNVGLYPNWDLLLRSAAGTYFKILPSDDRLDERFVARCVAALEQTGSDVALTGFRAFGSEQWQVLPERFGFCGPQVVADRREIVRQVAGITVLVPPTPGLYRTALVPEGFGSDVNSRGADMIYWARAVTRGQVVFINEPLAGIRFHERQERRAKDTSRAAADLFDALEILRPFDPGRYVDDLSRQVARTYGRSVLANLLRGHWGVARRSGRQLARRGLLAAGITGAIWDGLTRLRPRLAREP